MSSSPILTSSGRAFDRGKAARWVLAAAVLGSALALGTLHTSVLVVVVVALAAAAWLALSEAEPWRPRTAATILVWAAAFLTVWTALQAVPMPAPVVRLLSPRAADAWSRTLLPLGEDGPSWMTLSLDPVATRVQVARGIAYLLAFVVAVRVASRREGVAFLERALVVSGVVLAVAAWAHPALGAERVFGIYRPHQDPGVRHMGPILNANVLSGYLNVGLCVVFAQVLSPRGSVPRLIAIALTSVLVATQLWVASRGGTAAMVLGLALVLWMNRASGPGERSRWRGLLPLILAAGGITMGVLSSSEEAWSELSQTDVSKLAIAMNALQLVPLFPFFGLGRGAFESVFPIVRSDPSYLVYTHPENFVAQWATEWGVPVAALAFVAIAFALRPRTALARSPRAAGAWAAIACVAFHNLVDYSSEYPGVVIALTVCAALVAGGSGGTDEPRRADAWARAPRLLARLAPALGALAALLAASAVGRELFQDRDELRALTVDAGTTRAAFHSAAREAMLRHPAEPYLPYMGAVRAFRARDESVVGWVAKTIERAKIYGPAHFVLARFLAPRAPAQARLEYRLAMEQAPELIGVGECLRLVHGYDDARELLPEGRARPIVLASLAAGLAPRMPATAARLQADLLRADAVSLTVALAEAEQAALDVEQGEAAPWCWDDRKKCVEGALAAAARVEKQNPERCDGYRYRARVLLSSGDAAGATKVFETAPSKVERPTECLKQLAQLAHEKGLTGSANALVDQVARATCGDVKECVDNLVWVATLEQSLGNPRRALSMLQRAHDREPGDDEVLRRMAELAVQVESHAEALRAYEELARRHPEDPRWAVGVAAEKEALLRGSVKL